MPLINNENSILPSVFRSVFFLLKFAEYNSSCLCRLRTGPTGAMDAPEYESFKKGARVEVCFDDPGFRGSWYEATILETPPNFKKSLKVYLEFDNLLHDDNHGGDSPKRLREHVNYLLVRPLIPREPLRTFQLNDDVDAFHNEGWWEGVVTHVHPPPAAAADVSEPARYSVYFRCSREQIQFPASALRLHREWVYGEWVPPLKEEKASAEASSTFSSSEMK